MHNSILLALWAGGSFVLYKIVAYLLTERYYRNEAIRLGCEPAHRFKLVDFQGIRTVSRMIAADKKFQIPEWLKIRIDDARADKGNNITTFSQKILGTRSMFTVDPKNVQAVLATQFKDFGLGEKRNVNFSALLGQGIVRFTVHGVF
jgi:hypothetical protein